MIGLPGLYGFTPLLAETSEANYHLHIDVRDNTLWQVEWKVTGIDANRRGEWAAEPFLREGLALLERLWPEGPRQAALRPGWESPLLHDGASAPVAPVLRGAFRLRPLAAGLGLDQTFAFAPSLPSGPVEVELRGLKPGIAVEMAGFELVSPAGHHGSLRLAGRIGPAPNGNPIVLGPLRLHLSSHGDHQGLARAIRSRFDAGDPPLPAAKATPSPDRMTLRTLMRNLPAARQATFPPGRKYTSEAAPLGLENERALRQLDHAIALQAEFSRYGWRSQLVLTNRRPLLALPLQPVFLFDTVLVELPDAKILLDPTTGLLLDSEIPHPDLSGKTAMVVSQEEASLRVFRALRPADHAIVVRAQLNLDHHGGLEGQSRTEAHGAARPQLAVLTQHLSKHAGALAELLRRQKLVGVARLGPQEEEADSLSQHLEIQLGGAGSRGAPALPVASGAGPRLFKPPLAILLPALQSGGDAPVPCQALRLDQEIVLHVPEPRLLLDIPPDLSVETAHGRYHARYWRGAGNLHIWRQLEIDPPGPVCSAELLREMAPVLRAAGRDFDRPLNLRLSP